MNQPGPPLELLLRRLAETPPDFLAEPIVAGGGAVDALAVVSDLLRLHGATGIDPGLGELGRASGANDRNRLRLVLVLSWLLADEWFVAGGGRDPGLLVRAIAAVSSDLAPLVPAGTVVESPERREELARLALAALSFRPAGESEAFARDRLTTLSTAERARVLAASRSAEQRARAIREALAKKAAEESADKWSRE